MNLNKDYLIVVDVKAATVNTPNAMQFYITDIKTANIFAQLVVNESKSPLITKYAPVENSEDFYITLRVIKPNNQALSVDFNLLNQLEAFFMVDLTDEYKDYIGEYQCELFIDCMVNGELERITTSAFTYEVLPSIMNNLDEVIEGDPDYPLVDEILKRLEENGANIDLSDYATIKYVDESIANIEIPEQDVDLSAYAPINNPNFTGSISLGRKEDTGVGLNSTALGYDVTATGEGSHAEGQGTTASGYVAHAEGGWSEASGQFSHAEGQGTIANQYCAHAEGMSTTASGHCSHAEGGSTIAASSHQHVQGLNNIEDTEGRYAHIVGNGFNGRANAHTLDWQGNGWYAGNLYVGGESQDDAKKVATESYVNEALSNVSGGSGECNIPVIGGQEETHIFSPDDVPDNSDGVYLLKNVEVNGGTYIEVLMTISTWTVDDNVKCIEMIDTWGNCMCFCTDENGELVLEDEYYFVQSGELELYADKEYVDSLIGDIEAALSAILGGEDNE